MAPSLRLHRCFLLITFVVLGSTICLPQSTDPIVGTWNLSMTNSGTVLEIGVQTFNEGGTTVEYDTGGTNPAGNPGESIVLGNWTKNSDGSYDIKQQNYIYDSTGALKYVALTGFRITIDPTNDRFSGLGGIHFNFCSLTQCPGPFFAASSFQISGKRF